MKTAKLDKENIDEFLNRHLQKELLRFVTVGSVDDGKSTLIGRLLHDTESVYLDQLESVKKSTGRGLGEEIDLSLITDGLKAEREQGITIDVAYRYFTTEKRKFILADTPGHVQYTRNMATGASTADVAIILIDARYGVQVQSRRHAFIASLLRIPNLAVCINKMDLKNYDQAVFESIKKDFSAFARPLGFKGITYFPISALKGDNVVGSSKNTPWYVGETLLNFLETVPLETNLNFEQFSFPVQYVNRPNIHFRGYCGTVASGRVAKGDKIIVLPSGKHSTVKSIVTSGGELKEAFAPQAVTLTLADEIDISRGDTILHEKNVFQLSREFSATLVWMNEQKLECGKQYWIKQAASLVIGVIEEVEALINVDTLEESKAKTLELNEIGKVRVTLNKPLIIDAYKNNRALGAFIVIDRLTNATVAAGMIAGAPQEKKKGFFSFLRR